METKSYSHEPASSSEDETAHERLPDVDREHYAIGAEIARGGMGRVLEARDLRLGRDVAIKELLPNKLHHLQRFEREARVTARLQHPAIIHVYEAGRWPDGQPFYAMTRVAGRSLDKVIAERTTLAARLGLVPHVIATAHALAYAHSQRVIHRDLKPSNVLVGDFGETVVIDWGLAKAGSDPAGDAGATTLPEPGYTADGSIIGTPGYMAPEQARSASVDARADVYSIGAILYEVIGGSPPYGHGTSNTILEQVLAGPAPAIRAREANVPVDLAAIVDKAMARDPAARYADAGELVADLERFETGQLVAARHYSRRQRIARFLRRHAVIVGFAVALAIVALVSAARIVASRNDALAARADADARNDALVLLQARAELTRDPTASLAWLKRYPAAAPGWDQAREIASDAWTRGVALHVWDFGSPLGAVAFSPDGKTLAVGALDGTLTFVDLASGRRQALHAPDGTGDRIVFSPDGTQVATSDGHEAVRLWDRASGTSRRLAGEHTGGPTMQFSPDGSLLYVRHLGGDYRSRLWRVPDGEPVAVPLEGTALAFVPHSRLLVVSKQGQLAIVNPDTGETVARTQIDHEPTEIAVSGDGQWIALARVEALVLWNPTTNVTRTVHTGKNVVSLLDVSGDGAHLVSCGMLERDLWLFDIATATAQKLSTDERCMRQAGFSPDGKIYLSAGLGGELRLHLVAGGQTRLLLGHQAAVTDAVFSPDGRYLASASSDHTVRLWKWNEGEARLLVDAFSPDRLSTPGRLLLAEPGHPLVVLDVKTGQRTPVDDVPEHVLDTALSSNGQVVAFITAEGAVVRRDLATGSSRALTPPGLWITSGITYSALSIDGQRLVQIDPRGVARLFDLMTGGVRELTRFDDVSFAMAFSDDGALLAAGSRDGTVRVLDVASGGVRADLQFHTITWNLAVSGDDRFVAAACGDGVLRIIELATGRVQELRGHVGPLGGVDLDRDGRDAISSGVDGTVRRWDLASGRGLVIHREPFPVTSVQYVRGTSLVIERGYDARVFRVWDASVLPSPRAGRAELARWLADTTSAEVDEGGGLASPVARP